MTDIFKSVRDEAGGTILFNGKIIGWIKSLSKTIDNNPIDYDKIDSRTKTRFQGAISISGTIDKLHDMKIDGNLFELALGKKLIENGVCLIKKGEKLTHEYSLTQLGKNSEYELHTDRQIGQSFYTRAIIPKTIQMYLKKIGAGLVSGLQVAIYNDSGDNPDAQQWLKTVANADIPADGWLSIGVTGGITLPAETKHWILLKPQDTGEGEAGVSGVTVAYNSVSDDFADGHGEVKVGAGDWTELDYDFAFQLISEFDTDRGFEIVEKQTNGSKTETTTYKKVRITANDITVEGNSLLIDSGSWNAEDIESVIS